MQPITNKCRCCLREGEHTHNIFDDLYMEMLKETLSLLPTRDSRLTQWICLGCVNSLKEVKRFRDMVMAAEKLLLQTITNCHLSEITVWIKEEPRDLETDGGDHADEDSTILPSDSVSTLDDAEIRTPVPCTPHKRNLGVGPKHDRKRKKYSPPAQSNEKWDSKTDNPCYDVKEERTRNENVGCSTDAHGNNSEIASTKKQFPTKHHELEPSTPNTLVIVPDVRSILGNFTPERPVKAPEPLNTKRRLTGPTKLRENIILLMQHSTIIPFRHNSNFLNDYICYYCENTYKTMKELKEHTESEHVGKVNDETIMTFMRTRAHKLINADISCIKCRLCYEQVTTVENLIEHLTKVHKKVYHDTGKRSHGILGFVLSPDELECHLCNNNFESFRSLFSHMNDHYEAYICFCCQKKFVNQLRYRTHLKTHIIREDKEFKCDDCGAICKTKTGLVYHMKRHHLNVILKCEQCPETFRFKEYRKRDEHMVEVHGMKRPDNKYTCDICQNGKIYSSKNTLKIHKSNVHKLVKMVEQSHACAICDACVQRLQDAAQFKHQVQECEIQFQKLYRNENISVPVTKRFKHKTKMVLSKVSEKKTKVGRPKKHTVLLKNNGYDKEENDNCKTNKDIGHNRKNKVKISYSNKSVEGNGYNNKNNREIGYNNKNVKEICYSNISTEEFGYSNKSVIEDIGFSIKNIENIGYKNKGVEENGYSTKNIKEMFINKNMREICYSNKNMEEFVSRNKNMEDIGYSNKNIKEFGYSDNLLKNNFGNGNNETIFCEYDSDTPISRLSKEYADNKNTLTAGTDKSDLDGRNESINSICKPPQYRASGTKLVSERKRIRLTCETVLKDTSACPFRHHRSWFRCFYCTLDFMDVEKLRQHTLKSHNAEDIANIKIYPRTLQIDISEFRCKICTGNLTDVKDMVEHFLKVHEKVVYKECIADYKVNTSPYTCHLCRKQYHVFRTLTTHLNEHYANCICDVCGKPFLNSKRLKVHKRTHESGNFPCSECGKILKTKTSIANHMESHSKRILKCHICSKPMKHYNDRIKHMSEVHNITHTFKCVICGREYNIKHYLATHMRQTHGHKNKKCLECGMAFITNHGLKKHMLKHTGEKAFSCTICSKAYARSYSLKEHMRVHGTEKVDQ